MDELAKFVFPLAIQRRMTAQGREELLASLVALIVNDPVIPPASKPMVVAIVVDYYRLTPGGGTPGFFLAKNFYLALRSILDKQFQHGSAIPRFPDVADGPPVPLDSSVEQWVVEPRPRFDSRPNGTPEEQTRFAAEALASPPVAFVAVLTSLSARSAASGVRSVETRKSALLSYYADYYRRQDGWSESDAQREAGRVVGNLRDAIQEAHFAVTDPGELIAFGGAFCDGANPTVFFCLCSSAL